MNFLLRSSISAFLLTIIGLVGYAQNVSVYNNYLLNQQEFNPAYTGVHGYFVASAHHRSQWVNLSDAPSQSGVELQGVIGESNLGFGASVNQFKAGALGLVAPKCDLSYKINLSENSLLSFGLSYQYLSKEIDFGELNLEEDDVVLDNTSNGGQSLIGAGLFLSNKKWYVGYSIPTLGRLGDDLLLENVPVHHLSAGYLYTLTCYLRLKGYTLIRLSDGQVPSLDLNIAGIINDKYWVNASLRNLHSFGTGISAEVSEAFRTGYNMNFPLGGIASGFTTTHEIVLSYDFVLGKKGFLKQRYW